MGCSSEFVQDFIPIKDLRHGIIETTDGRYIKILEIEPINFMLRSDDEQFSIISTFASWLKISPMKLQFKSITRRADSDKHVTLVVLVLFHSIFMLGYVPTESMEPTLETGSLILGLRIFDELETGDIIIFRRDGSYLVKRIAACAGDTIDHQNSIVTVPDNCYYVLGDNAENSHDSRYWADPYVSHEDVIAKLLMPIK